MDRERSRLSHMADMVRDRFRAVGIDTGLSSTQIVPAIIGESEATLALSAALEDAGILASAIRPPTRSEEHTSELQSLMRISYAVFCLKKTTTTNTEHNCESTRINLNIQH